MSSDNGDPDISRIFSQKVDRRFQRDFGRLIQHQQQGLVGGNGERNEPRKSNNADLHLNVKLIEAKEEVEKLRRQLNKRDKEIEEIKAGEAEAKEKVEDLQSQLDELKKEVSRERHTSNRNFNDSKTEEKLLLDDYRAVLSKYRTWMQFSQSQLVTMKTLLEELGGWNEPNRYKIYFSYRAIQPEMINDDKVTELSTGTVFDYPGAIENVEGITSTQVRPKFHSIFTQTEECALAPSFTSQQSHSFLNKSFTDGEAAPFPAGEQLSAQEMRLMDCERQIERLEIQNAQMHEQNIILSDRAKYVELLEEQKQDLQMQIDILRRQNDHIIKDHEELKSIFGGSSITRNSLEALVRSAEQQKTRNQELEQKLHQLEGQKDAVSLAESRRIAQMFRQKYENELADLRAKLNKHEPMHASDTTRIYRFAQNNPLDEAHEEHFVKQALNAATTTTTGNPLKRRKMDDEEFGETSASASAADLTFLAEEEDSNQIRQLRLQLANVKQQMEKNEKSHADFLGEYRELVSQLSGYDIRLGEDGFGEAENTNSRDCTFLFQKRETEEEGGEAAGWDLLENETTQRWKDVMENYLVRYQSMSAFLSAVTISLVESPETPLQSTISIVEEEEEEGDTASTSQAYNKNG